MIDAVLRPLAALNSALLAIGRALGAVAVALMVVAILIQVVFRYGFNNALPWPDEAARFCMLWMTGLMAPTALRSGGFVAIDTIQSFLPAVLGRALTTVMLGLSFAVILMALKIGWNEVTGFGGLFKTASLYLPTSFSFDSWYRLPRSTMMASLVVGFALMALVNLELILRALSGREPHIEEGEYAGGAE
ncbi:MAG: TRAP transporter small permease [Pseudomonadota bacterium]